MIVVDSSVWISLLRGAETASVRRLRAIEPLDEILVGDIILLELLQGARDRSHAARIEAALKQFRIETMLGPTLAVIAASHYRQLREMGITLRKTVDLIIGSFCIVHGHRLLHADRDFDPMADHLGLQTID